MLHSPIVRENILKSAFYVILFCDLFYMYGCVSKVADGATGI